MRGLAGVVVGLLAMLLLSVLNLAGMWFGLGWEFAFEGEGPRASWGWVMGMLFGGCLSAYLGGRVCGEIAGAGRGFAVPVLCLFAVGLAVAGSAMGRREGESRLPEGKSASQLSFAEAGEYAVSPGWYYVAIGVASPTCVWLGGRGSGQPS
jgi:hypothetical protein